LKNQLFSEGKLYSSTSLISTTALHIDIISLVDDKYEFTQDPDRDFSSEAQANVELTEAPNSDSEEPQLIDFINTDTGKPRCIIPLL